MGYRDPDTGEYYPGPPPKKRRTGPSKGLWAVVITTFLIVAAMVVVVSSEVNNNVTSAADEVKSDFVAPTMTSSARDSSSEPAVDHETSDDVLVTAEPTPTEMVEEPEPTEPDEVTTTSAPEPTSQPEAETATATEEVTEEPEPTEPAVVAAPEPAEPTADPEPVQPTASSAVYAVWPKLPAGYRLDREVNNILYFDVPSSSDVDPAVFRMSNRPLKGNPADDLQTLIDGDCLRQDSGHRPDVKIIQSITKGPLLHEYRVYRCPSFDWSFAWWQVPDNGFSADTFRVGSELSDLKAEGGLTDRISGALALN